MMRTASNLVGEPLFNVVIAEGARGQALKPKQNAQACQRTGTLTACCRCD